MVYMFFDNKTGPGAKTGVYEELAQELHKPEIKNSKRRKAYPRFKDNICVANLADMGSLFSKYRGVKCLLCVMNVFTNGLNLRS